MFRSVIFAWREVLAKRRNSKFIVQDSAAVHRCNFGNVGMAKLADCAVAGPRRTERGPCPGAAAEEPPGKKPRKLLPSVSMTGRPQRFSQIVHRQREGKHQGKTLVSGMNLFSSEPPAFVYLHRHGNPGNAADSQTIHRIYRLGSDRE